MDYFCGRPGSGKSYGVVENVILPAIRAGRLIYTNIPLNIEEIMKDYSEAAARIVQFTNEQVNGEFLMSIPGGALIVIDEVWRFWPAGTKVNDIPALEKEFFAEHRHKAGVDKLTQEIVLISQSPSQIAKYLRDLIDKTVLTIKADKVGLKNQYQVQIFSACIPSLERPGDPNTTGMGTYKKEIYKYYKSHTKSETGLPGIEIKADKRGGIWSNWYIRYLSPIIMIGAIWGGYYLITFFSGDAFAKPAPIIEPTQEKNFAPALSQTKLIIPAKSNEPIESQTMRIAAHVVINGQMRIYIARNKDKHLMQVIPDRCKWSDNGLECIHKGEIVTRYTGSRDDPEEEKVKVASILPRL